MYKYVSLAHHRSAASHCFRTNPFRMISGISTQKTPQFESSGAYFCGVRKPSPTKMASLPSSSSIRSSWLYLAVRSPRHGAPVLICPVQSPTARSAMVVSYGEGETQE